MVKQLKGVWFLLSSPWVTWDRFRSKELGVCDPPGTRQHVPRTFEVPTRLGLVPFCSFSRLHLQFIYFFTVFGIVLLFPQRASTEIWQNNARKSRLITAFQMNYRYPFHKYDGFNVLSHCQATVKIVPKDSKRQGSTDPSRQRRSSMLGGFE